MPDFINQINPRWTVITSDGDLSESQTAFDPASTTGMIPYRVPHDDLPIVPQHFTGYSYVSAPIGGIGSYELRRVLPQAHPFWEGLWGTRINVRGEAAWDVLSLTKGNRFGPYDRYDNYRVEVYYARRPYDVLANGGRLPSYDQDGNPLLDENGVPQTRPIKEQDRFVEKLPARPYTEVVQIEGGTLYFSDGAKFMQGASFRVGKSEIKWVWHQVPIQWATNRLGVASNIEFRIGTLNNAVWEGYPVGTLYLSAVDVDYEYAMSPPLVLGLPNYSPPRYLRIAFDFKYQQQGWNKVLRPSTRTWQEVRFRPPGVAWADGLPLYESTDFDKLFEKAT